MHRIAIFPFLIVLTNNAFAGEAHVCDSPDTSPIAQHQARISDNTVFRCGNKISGTIPELARDGWEIIQLTEQSGEINMPDPSKSISYTQLVIQRD